MKKLLSLVLAVMMIASLAVSSSAAVIIKSDGTIIKNETNNDNDYEEIIDYYERIYGSDDDVPYYGTIGADRIGGFFNKCSECGDMRYCFIYDGVLYGRCLNKKCDNDLLPGGDKEEDKEDDKDHDHEDDNVTNIYGEEKCTECGKKRTVRLDSVKIGNAIYDRYFCLDCDEVFVVKTSQIDLDDFKAAIECPAYKCDKKADFYNFILLGDDLYAYYICECGKVTSKLVERDYDCDFDITDNFKIVAKKSGKGTVEICGASLAEYGDTREIRITPAYGYILVDVYVNGKSIGAEENFTLKVTGDTYVHAYFAKVSTVKTYEIETEAIGNGKITAKKNGATVNASEISVNTADTVTFTFKPTSANYVVKSVIVNGKNVGAVSSYTVKKAVSDIEIVVTFGWKCPYVDIESKYLAAVEYVTEAGIMTTYRQTLLSRYFAGRAAIKTHIFAASLAEMADTNNVLYNLEQRLEWVYDHGLLVEGESANYTTITVQKAAEIVSKYLAALEEINGVKFVKFDADADAKTNAISINLATEATYDGNRKLHRYDLAAVCYLIANLEIAE
ncbi:MAG: hypothetical protein E7672_01390 [Ruminococcaceae bacterium]|nr:hypothetical protein [Oscillospiraceae bacterium]